MTATARNVPLVVARYLRAAVADYRAGGDPAAAIAIMESAADELEQLRALGVPEYTPGAPSPARITGSAH